MSTFLETYPSKRILGILLITGSILFLPFYTYNYRLVTGVMGMETLTQLLTSFDAAVFNGIISSMREQGHLSEVFRIYVVNIISTTGFMLLVVSLTVSIARTTKQASFIHRVAFVIPALVPVIALLDIFSSILFLFITRHPEGVSGWIVYTIDLCYVTRLPLLYLVLLWMIIGGIVLLIGRIRSAVKKKG